eukprot:12886370-Alexandrium_andersonii.AAC.1
MSASLVGSEMCIRDSFRSFPELSEALGCPQAFKSSREFSRSCPEPSGAVSYTHLTLPTICSV